MYWKNLSLFLFGIFVGVAAVFIWWVLTTTPNTTASVEIINHSGKVVKNIVLQHRDGSATLTRPLANNDQAEILFQSLGENSYNIIVTFDNDSRLTSGVGYFEWGGSFVEIIEPKKIRLSGEAW